MNRMPRSARTSLRPAVLGLLVALPSAHPPAAFPVPVQVLQATRPLGASRLERLPDSADGWTARGADFEARFGDGGFEYRAAMGADASRGLSLRFEFRTAGRGAESMHVGCAASALELAPDTIGFQRGAGVVERYEVRAEGVEQSFRFERPLPGTGELMVRGRLSGDAPFLRVEDGGLIFGEAGLGEIRMGRVSGVDARGATCSGSLRWKGGEVELSLPAAFVDGAAYPLVLDPWISSQPYATPSLVGGKPELAYDATNACYLMVYEQAFSSTDVDILGQFLNQDGTPRGASFVIDASGVSARAPVVANVNLTDSFLVVWSSRVFGQQLMGQTLAADGSYRSATVRLLPTGTGQDFPDLGGEATLVDDEAILVWSDSFGPYIAQVTVAAGTEPVLFGEQYASGGSTYAASISSTGGDTGIYFVAASANGAFRSDTVVSVVDRDLNPLVQEAYVANPELKNQLAPRIDGDGEFAVVVYAQQETKAQYFPQDIHVQVLHYDGTWLWALSESVLPEQVLSANQSNPVVAWTGDKYVAAWDDVSGEGGAVMGITSLCATSGLLCDEIVLTVNATNPALATVTHGDATSASQDALVVYELPGTGSDLGVTRWAGLGGGAAIDLGGGCGTGGSLAVNGPVAIANSSWSVDLSGASTAASSVLLNIHPGSLAPFTCGSCVAQLGPGLRRVGILAGGSASFSLPIPPDPNLVGVSAELQAFAFGAPNVDCSRFTNVSMSNRVRVTIDY